MKLNLTLLLISSLLLTTACSKSNKGIESEKPNVEDVAATDQDSRLNDMKADIESKGPIALQDWINQQVQEMYGTPNPYTIEIKNLKHVDSIKDNNTEIFNWDVTLSNLSTGHSFNCESEEVTLSPDAIEPGVTLSNSCIGELTTNLEQLSQFQTQQIPTESPIKINFLPNESWDHMSNLKVQATVDAVTITGVKVNRGNCTVNKIEPNQVLNLPLGFSGARTFTLYCNPRDILEVEINTDQGVWTFKP